MPLRLKLAAGVGIATFSWIAAHLLTAMLLARPERFLDEQAAQDLTPIHASRPMAPPDPAPAPDPPPPVADTPPPPPDPMPPRACEITRADGTILHCSAEQLAQQPEPSEPPAPVYSPPGYAMQSGYPMQAAQPEDDESPPQWSGEPDVYGGPAVIVGRVARPWHRAPAVPPFGGRGSGGPRIVVRSTHLHP